jgi:hydrogenase nickel incorporation protein HypA/HybF
VTDIYITLGQLSSIVDDSVQFYWEYISQETICAGASLHFERIPAKLECQQCGHTYGIESMLQACPQCGSMNAKIVAGEEFWVDSIAIEKEEETAT